MKPEAKDVCKQTKADLLIAIVVMIILIIIFY
jgi:hypothetical protein